MKKLMLCKYPKEGFGGNCGSFYLMDELGNKYIIKREADETGSWLAVDLPGNLNFSGDNLEELVTTLKLFYKISRW